LSHRTAFVWSDEYLKYSFPGDHPFKSLRESMTRKILETKGAFHEIDLVEPELIDESTLRLVHSKEYIEFVKEMSRKGQGMLDEFDTPAFPGIYEAALVRVSGTVTALNLLEKYDHAVNVGGGFHHAKRDAASGFCVFNDVALTAKLAEKKYGRVAVIDIDGHHGDGTQFLLYDDPNVLKVSLHMYHPNFFPGTGNYDEIGVGEGEGYTLNVPLPPGTGDDLYIKAFDEVVVPKVRQFKPNLIIFVVGGDSHFDDPLVELKLTTLGYLEIAKRVHSLAHEFANGKLIMTGAGGYSYESTARVWATVISEIANLNPLDFEDLHDCCMMASRPHVKDKVFKVIEELKKLHSL
jgi:acetoin utilization protein AcuC